MISYTFERMKELVKRLASGLGKAGFKAGDRLMVIAPDNIYNPVIMLATIAAGGIFVGLDPDFVVEQQAGIIKHCGPTFILARKEVGTVVSSAVGLAGKPGARLYFWDDALFQYQVPFSDTKTFEHQHTLLNPQGGPSFQWKTFETEEDAETTALIIYTPGWARFLFYAIGL